MRASRQDHEGARLLPAAARGAQKVQKSRKGIGQSTDLRPSRRHRIPQEDQIRSRGAGGHREEREFRADSARGGEPVPGGAE